MRRVWYLSGTEDKTRHVRQGDLQRLPSQAEGRAQKGQQNRIGVGTLRRPKTCAYLRRKIAQKKAHIEREQERVAILEELLDEQERT